MKAKKPLLLAVLVVALLAVALIVPATVSGKNVPHNWATWGGNVQLEVPIPWQATFQVHVQQKGTEVVGREVMNWISEVFIPVTAPKGHSVASYVESKFVDKDADDPEDPRLEPGGYKATIIFRFDTEELGWPEGYDDYVYHVWVLIDNPRNGMDHVDVWSQMLDEEDTPPDIDDPDTWGGHVINDMQVRGVQVVVNE